MVSGLIDGFVPENVTSMDGRESDEGYVMLIRLLYQFGGALTLRYVYTVGRVHYCIIIM